MVMRAAVPGNTVTVDCVSSEGLAGGGEGERGREEEGERGREGEGKRGRGGGGKGREGEWEKGRGEEEKGRGRGGRGGEGRSRGMVDKIKPNPTGTHHLPCHHWCYDSL